MANASFAARRRRLVKLLRREKLDALLATNSHNLYYLSGFRGEDSALLVADGEAHLVTDSRFTEQAGQETRGVRIITRRKGLMRAAAEVARRAGVGRLGIESAAMTVAELEELRRWTGKVQVTPVRGLVERLRVIKDASELAAIERAIAISEEAFRLTVQRLAPGVSELELARLLDRTMEELGAEQPGFETIVAFGERPSLPHARPSQRKLKRGEAVLFDWGARFQMYNADLTRMAFLDRIAPLYRRLHSVVLAAQRRAVRQVRSGRTAGAIDAVARNCLKAHRHGKHFGHSLGHGVGLDVHEAPTLARGQKTVLRPGMVITIEPGVYLPGEGGVRIEDMLRVTHSGHVSLTSLPRSVGAFLVA